MSEPVVGQSSPSTQLADLPETAQVDDGPTTIDYEVAPPVNTLIPQVCGSGEGDDCSPYAPLPVADGVSDFYVGPADLGTPVVALHDFVPLVRCAELDPSATVCNRLEGWAGVALTRYPSEVTVDTTGVELNHAPDVEIGTTFTEITPLQYAGEWVSKTAAGGNIEEVVVRGNPAIIINEFASRYVVWNERPGVLVWVRAANDAQGDLLAIAEGVRRVPGPDPIAWVVSVPDEQHLSGYDADDNDADTLVIAKQRDGADCVGFGYVEAVGTCGGTIDEQTFVAIVGDRALVTGLAPSNVTAIRISQNGTQLVETSTRQITMSDDALFGEFVDVEGPISVEWIDATGVVASTEVAVDFCRTACG